MPLTSRTYRITPIQQPERSAAFNGLYLSRLPLSPPLIVQFDCWTSDGELIIPYVHSCWPGLTLITLCSPMTPLNLRHTFSFGHPLYPSFRHTSFLPNSYDELAFLVCSVSLEMPEGGEAMMVDSPDGLVSMLYGTLVVGAAEMQDRAGASGVYFAFPDVSVRYVGRFRLRVNVMRITG